MRIHSKGAIASSISQGGGAFSPSDISGLQMWYDFSSTDYMTIDGSNNITQINDRSGNARHGTQADTGLTPVYTASVLNSLGGGNFTNGDEILALASTYSAAQPYTVFCLVTAADTTTDKWSFRDATTSYMWYSQYTARLYIKAGTQANGGNNSYDTSALLTRAEFNTTSSKVVNRLVTTTGLDCGSSNFTFAQLGQFKGYMFEMLVYSSVLSSGDISSVETYFSGKWGSGL